MFNGKLKGSLKYFFEDENFGRNLWNPYLIWENSKFETETSKFGGARAIRFGCKSQEDCYASPKLPLYYNLNRKILHKQQDSVDNIYLSIFIKTEVRVMH